MQSLRLHHSHQRTLITALFLFLLALTARAQVVGGTISGTVTDPTGAVVPNAHVLVHNDDTGTQRALTTGSAGTFSAPSIPVGRYTISTEVPGFAPYKRVDVALTVGQSLDLTLKLSISGSESVSVEDTPPAVNLSTEQTSGLVD